MNTNDTLAASRTTSPIDQILLAMISNGVTGMTSRCSIVPCLLDGVKFKQTDYALDRNSRKAALARFLSKAACERPAETEDERPLAA
jgi:hypothetical protein